MLLAKLSKCTTMKMDKTGDCLCPCALCYGFHLLEWPTHTEVRKAGTKQGEGEGEEGRSNPEKRRNTHTYTHCSKVKEGGGEGETKPVAPGKAQTEQAHLLMGQIKALGELVLACRPYA